MVLLCNRLEMWTAISAFLSESIFPPRYPGFGRPLVLFWWCFNNSIVWTFLEVPISGSERVDNHLLSSLQNLQFWVCKFQVYTRCGWCAEMWVPSCSRNVALFGIWCCQYRSCRYCKPSDFASSPGFGLIFFVDRSRDEDIRRIEDTFFPKPMPKWWCDLIILPTLSSPTGRGQCTSVTFLSFDMRIYCSVGVAVLLLCSLLWSSKERPQK